MKMKNKIWSAIHLPLLIMLATSTPSCDEIGSESAWERPDDLSPYLTTQAFQTLYSYSSYFTSNGTTDSGTTLVLNDTLLILPDMDFWQIKVAAVDYLFNDSLIYKAISAPFPCKQEIRNIQNGLHILKAKVQIEDLKNGNEYVVTLRDTLVINHGQATKLKHDAIRAQFYIDLNRYIKPGEPLVVTPYLLTQRSDANERQIRDGWRRSI